MRRREFEERRKSRVDTYKTQEIESKKKYSSTSQNDIAKKRLIKFFVWLVVFIFVFIQTVDISLYTIGKKEKKDMWLYNSFNSVMNFISSKKTAKLTTKEYEVSIAALGDIYSNSTALKNYKSGNDYDFYTSLSGIGDTLSKYDIVIASLNAPVVDNATASKSSSNALPKSIINDIKKLNVSVLVTATSNIYSSSLNGLKSTISSLKGANINYVGIDENSDTKPIIIEKNNIKIGIISYMTESTNKISTGDKEKISTFSEDKVKKDMEYLNSKGTDYTIAYIDSTNKNTTIVSAIKKQAVEVLIKEGVDVIFGTGNMIIQENFEDLVDTKKEVKKHIYTVYSLGDFVGSASTVEEKTSMIANIKFTKEFSEDKKGNIVNSETKHNMFVEEPIILYTDVSSSKKRTVYNLTKLLEKYKTNSSILTKTTYNKLLEIRDRVVVNIKEGTTENN